jgi:hypothetical protein
MWCERGKCNIVVVVSNAKHGGSGTPSESADGRVGDWPAVSVTSQVRDLTRETV